MKARTCELVSHARAAGECRVSYLRRRRARAPTPMRARTPSDAGSSRAEASEEVVEIVERHLAVEVGVAGIGVLHQDVTGIDGLATEPGACVIAALRRGDHTERSGSIGGVAGGGAGGDASAVPHAGRSIS